MSAVPPLKGLREASVASSVDDEAPNTPIRRQVSSSALSSARALPSARRLSIARMGAGVQDSAVKVAVRVRPFNTRERLQLKEREGKERDSSPAAAGRSEPSSAFQMLPSQSCVHLVHAETVQQFSFDYVFWSLAEADAEGGAPATQEDVYKSVGAPLIGHSFAGFNSCLLAYGQTGSGKTHTMMGSILDGKAATDTPNEGWGITPRLCADVFARKQALEKHNPSALWVIQVAYIEIYN
jgi:hypothetical protein